MALPVEQNRRKNGHQVIYQQVKSILTKPSGFIGAYDFTLNPYAGCTFGCSYCYAAFFASTEALKSDWGNWVQVKANALELLTKRRKKPLIDQTLYMSSVTDPYQPIERELGLTRAILEELLAYHQVRLVVQTRGPLVTRDIDLLKKFTFVQVNMTITTDDEAIRRLYEPTCPSVKQRLAAITAVQAAGIPTCITMTPLLPLTAPEDFARCLAATGVQRFVVQAFHNGHSRFAAGTGTEAVELSEKLNWTAESYAQVYATLSTYLPNLREGQAGFIPYWLEKGYQ